MNGDLISREALKKALKSNCDLCHDKNTNWCENCCPHNDFEDLIDNAPTVDAIPNAEGYEMYNKGYVQGYKRDKAEAIPKGEWEEPFESNGKTYHKCTHCHISSELTLFNNFCPNCGADMRGDAE